MNPIWRDSRYSVKLLDSVSGKPVTESIDVFENMPDDHDPMFCIYN